MGLTYLHDLVRHINRLTLLVCICAIVSGCSNIVVQQDKIINKGLYQVDIVGENWKTPDLVHYEKNLFIDLDAIKMKCPDEQLLGIYRIKYPQQRGVIPTEYFIKTFWSDFNGVLGYKINGLVSMRHLADYRQDADEIEYTFTETSICNDTAGIKKKSKMLIIKEGRSLNPVFFMQPKLVVLFYSSPIETYDSSLPEFEQMKQSFRLLK